MQHHIKATALAIMCLASCNSDPSRQPSGSTSSPTVNQATDAQRDPGQFKDWLVHRTQDAVKARLKDPASAQFSNVHTVTYEGASVVCGYVNAKNGFGGMTAPQKFVGMGETVFVEEDGDSAVQEAWSMMGC